MKVETRFDFDCAVCGTNMQSKVDMTNDFVEFTCAACETHYKAELFNVGEEIHLRLFIVND